MTFVQVQRSNAHTERGTGDETMTVQHSRGTLTKPCAGTLGNLIVHNSSGVIRVIFSGGEGTNKGKYC